MSGLSQNDRPHGLQLNFSAMPAVTLIRWMSAIAAHSIRRKSHSGHS